MVTPPACTWRARCQGDPATVRVRLRVTTAAQELLSEQLACGPCLADLVAPWARWQTRPLYGPAAEGDVPPGPPSLDTRQQVRRQVPPAEAGDE